MKNVKLFKHVFPSMVITATSYWKKLTCLINRIGCLNYVDTIQKCKKVVHDGFVRIFSQRMRRVLTTLKKAIWSFTIQLAQRTYCILSCYFFKKYKKGLGILSAQAFESVHFDCLSTWFNYEVSENKIKLSPP